ncbi:MAG: carboxypeptidase-like regulatory domain-containing protein [Planctomycetota bacterium]|nr:carboxypeptidase-like regulatory domain-containing protein [Planctomycetota bacterium]
MTRKIRHSLFSFALAALAILAGSSSAPLAAANVLQVGYASGSPGDNSVHMTITATNDEPVHGYSLALTWPTEALQLTDIGVCGTHVVELEPEFVAPQIDNELGIAQLGVIIEFDSPTGENYLEALSPQDSPRIVARLSFHVKPGAAGGYYPVNLVDGIGTPAAYNRFTNAGNSIEPELKNGTFFVKGENVLSLDRKLVFCGATPQVVIRALSSHPDPLDGFSIGISYDCDTLELDPEDALLGFDVTAALGNQVELFQTDVDLLNGPLGCRSRTGVIFDRVPPFLGQNLLPSTNSPPSQELMRYTFRIRNNAVDCASTEKLDLLLEELDQPGSLNNAYVVGASSITPMREHGKIYFCTATLRGRVVDAVTGSGLAGVRVVTRPEGISTTSSGNGAFVLPDMPPGEYALEYEKDGYYSTSLLEVTIGCDNDNVAEERGLYEIPPNCPPPEGSFRRGFINADTRSDLSDAISVFNYLFRGFSPPECTASADVNADNRLDISDGIFMLNFLFGNGPAPYSPYEECGIDPDNTLDCIRSYACEQ